MRTRYSNLTTDLNPKLGREVKGFLEVLDEIFEDAYHI